MHRLRLRHQQTMKGNDMSDQPYQHLPGVSRACKHDDGVQVGVYVECFFCGEVFEPDLYDSICPGCAFDCSKVEWVEDF